MEVNLLHRFAFPVGDAGSVDFPTVVALALHRCCTKLGFKGAAIAVATNIDMRIYYNYEIENSEWELVYKSVYDDHLPEVTSLDWNPVQSELCAGASNEIFLFFTGSSMESNRVYQRICPMSDDSSEKVCSISWNNKGTHIGIGYQTCICIVKRLEDRTFSTIKMISLPLSEYKLKFHPSLQYIFVVGKRNHKLQVFSNLSPKTEEEEWKLILENPVEGGRGLNGLSVYGKNQHEMTVIATSGTPGSIWNFFPPAKHADALEPNAENTSRRNQPVLYHAGNLKELPNLKNQLISVALINKKYLVGGNRNGSIVIFKGSTTNCDGKIGYMYSLVKVLWPHHKLVKPIPSVPCMLHFPARVREVITGDNYGVIHFKILRSLNKSAEPRPLEPVEWVFKYYQESGTMNESSSPSSSQPSSSQPLSLRESSDEKDLLIKNLREDIVRFQLESESKGKKFNDVEAYLRSEIDKLNEKNLSMEAYLRSEIDKLNEKNLSMEIQLAEAVKEKNDFINENRRLRERMDVIKTTMSSLLDVMNEET